MKALNFISKGLLLALIVLLCAPSASSQGELQAFYGYQFGGITRWNGGEARLVSNPNYGLGISFEVAMDTKVEILWNRQDTQLEWADVLLGSNSEDIAVEYFTIGSIREFPNGDLVPFGGIKIGTMVATLKESRLQEWWFALTLGGGIKYWISDNIGLRFDGNILFPMQFAGVGFWCGGGGCSTGASAYSSFLQGNVTGALVLRFGG